MTLACIERYSSTVKQLFISLFLSGALVGCASEDPWSDPGPKGAFEAYLMDMFRGDVDLAYQRILPEDRAVLAKALEGLDLPEEEALQEHEALVVAGADTPYDVRKIEHDPIDAEPKAGQGIVMKLEYHDGRNGEVVMVWQDGRWFVDLPL